MRQISIRYWHRMRDGNTLEPHGDWKNILSFFVFLIFHSKYHFLCFFNICNCDTCKNLLVTGKFWKLFGIFPIITYKMIWKMMKIHTKLKRINGFINKIIFKIFGPLAGSPWSRCLRHRGFAKNHIKNLYHTNPPTWSRNDP